MCDIYNKSKEYININFIYLYVYACVYPFD